jgi:uncharacterized protein (DUF58 family)
MNPINLLTSAIDSLWLWTYGIIAGWGLTLTIMVAALVVLLIRTINLQRRLDRLEARVITDEREYNLILKSWPGKKT